MVSKIKTNVPASKDEGSLPDPSTVSKPGNLDALIDQGGVTDPKKTALLRYQGRTIHVTPAVREKCFAIGSNPDTSKASKRRDIEILLGVRKAKKKYTTKDQRTAASKARSAERKAEKDILLADFGITRKKKEELSPEQKTERKRENRQRRRETKQDQNATMLAMVIKNPDLAKKLGIDVDSIKKRYSNSLKYGKKGEKSMAKLVNVRLKTLGASTKTEDEDDRDLDSED